MHYVLHYDVCAFILSAFSLFCIYIKKGTRNTQNKVFLLIIISNLFSIVADISSAIADMRPENYTTSYLYFINSLYMIFHMATPPLICFYMYHLLGFRRQDRSSVPWYIGVPYLISFLLIITTPFTHFIFYLDGDDDYTRAKGLIILYLITVAYLVIATFKMLKYRHATSSAKFIMLIMYIVLGVIGVVVQFIFPKLLVELFIESVACLGVLFSIENYDEMLDPNTRVYNRNALMTDIRKYLVSGIEFTLINVRLKGVSYVAGTLGVQNMYNLENQIVDHLIESSASEVYNYTSGGYAVICFDKEKAQSIADDLGRRFCEDWRSGRSKVRFGARINVARFPEEISSVDMVATMIDSPMEVSVYDLHSVEVVPYSDYRRENDIDRALQRAIAEKSFDIYYQPIYDLKKHRICMAEALMRLSDDELGDISPEEFVPIAEKRGYITEIGEYILDQVCHFYRDNRLDDAGIEAIDINLSAIQCMSDGFTERFKKIIRKSKVDPKNINLEVTESAIVLNREIMLGIIDDLTRTGISFSLDDFGTGYSNYSYILDFPLHMIKIDKSLLWSAGKTEYGEQVFRGMISMFGSMGMRTLVEGVESDGQKQLAAESGCDYIQGYYYSEPVKGETFLRYIHGFKE